MSAWTLSCAHIDALVLAGVQFGVIDEPTPRMLTALGADLRAVNHGSVNHSYDESDRPPQYTATIAEVVVDPVVVVKLVDCYVYQSCEHPVWDSSHAARYCRRLPRRGDDRAGVGTPARSRREALSTRMGRRVLGHPPARRGGRLHTRRILVHCGYW